MVIPRGFLVALNAIPALQLFVTSLGRPVHGARSLRLVAAGKATGIGQPTFVEVVGNQEAMFLRNLLSERYFFTVLTNVTAFAQRNHQERPIRFSRRASRCCLRLS
jgi:hypothetical protein